MSNTTSGPITGSNCQPTTTLQSNVNLRKNVSFNNQYFPQDTNQSVNDLTSSVALTHQKGHINQRFVVEALQAPDAQTAIPIRFLTRTSRTLPFAAIRFHALPNSAVDSRPDVLDNADAKSSGAFDLERQRRPGRYLSAALDDQMHPNGLGIASP